MCGSVFDSCPVYSDSISPENCNNDTMLFSDLVSFRKKNVSNFVFLHNNINSYRHKHIYTTDVLCNGLADFGNIF